MKKIIFTFLFLLLIIFSIISLSKTIFNFKNEKETTNTTQNTSDNETHTTSTREEPKTTLDFISLDSIYLLANKTHPLPSDYEPSDLVVPNVKATKQNIQLRQEAAAALEEMFNAALQDNITLILGSAYRSYDYQANLFSRYVKKDGEKKAATYSSRPGQSEHQTGLAADISDAAGNYFLKQSFEDTPEGIWLRDNAYRYGFILRYPKGKEQYTGYMFEPWHFRYIGKEEAEKVYHSNLSFEEYYNLLD